MRKVTLLSLALSLFCFLPPTADSQSCDAPLAQRDLAANNARARLLTGGDLWWDGSDSRYIIPNAAPGALEISALFAGALWMGGLDPARNLKLAAQTYGRSFGSHDYWPGPLDFGTGTTDEEVCGNWDLIFNVLREDIETHIADYEDNGQVDGPIPESLRGWPGRGNPMFFSVHGFNLLNTGQFLAPFFDRDGDGIYNPQQGDYPAVRGDEANWWVFNDNGNIHTVSQGDPIQMEIQATAFAFASSESYLNNSTFYEYSLIYRGAEPIDSFFLSLWVDPDLGCFSDDYIGCLPEEGLAFAYNGDAFDEDCYGLNGYGDQIPIVGIKVLKSLVRPGGEDGAPFSSFMYYLNSTPGTPSGTSGPSSTLGFYHFMTGRWDDGSPLTLGGNGYQTGGAPHPYAFDGSPVDGLPWTECNANTVPDDRRFLMSFGPITLQPGEIREFAFAVVWVPDQAYPCPGLSDLQEEADAVESFYESLPVSTQEEPALPRASVRCSPNPMRESTALQADAPIREVYLYSSQGQLLNAYTGLNAPSFTLHRQGLAAGLYFYRVVLKDGSAATGKLLVD